MPFDPEKNVILEDEVVLLRPLENADFDHLLPFAIQEPELWVHSPVPADGREKMKHYIDTAINARAAGDAYPFIVFDKRLEAYAGCTRFYDIQLYNQCLQLGYTWYGKQFQGTGLNKHCKYLLLELAFDSWDMERVEFRADYTNARSIAAMKRIGCKEEGVLRSNLLMPGGRRRDSIVLSILKGEWEHAVKEHLASLLHI
jgi:RimJ/RimL family protein N-acetyltransferase